MYRIHSKYIANKTGKVKYGTNMAQIYMSKNASNMEYLMYVVHVTTFLIATCSILHVCVTMGIRKKVRLAHFVKQQKIAKTSVLFYI